jgi:hypothetical protein
VLKTFDGIGESCDESNFFPEESVLLFLEAVDRSIGHVHIISSIKMVNRSSCRHQ